MAPSPALTDVDRVDAALLRGDALARMGREDEAIGVVGALAQGPPATGPEMRLRIAEVTRRAHHRRLPYHQAFEAQASSASCRRSAHSSSTPLLH